MSISFEEAIAAFSYDYRARKRMFAERRLREAMQEAAE